MILDSRPLLWATAPLLILAVGVGFVCTLAGRVPLESFGGFLAGSGLIWINLVLGALLVERVSDDIASGGTGGVSMVALLLKSMLLFGSFALLGQFLGMVPVVFGAAVTLVCFANAVVFVPLFTPSARSVEAL